MKNSTSHSIKKAYQPSSSPIKKTKKTFYLKTLFAKMKSLRTAYKLKFNPKKNYLFIKSKTQTFFKKPNRKMTFSVVVATLFVLLVAVAVLTNRKPEPIQNPQPRSLSVTGFVYGETPVQEEVVGTINNQNNITLVAQSNGPVSSVLVKEGDKISRGSILIKQESAYNAGNAQFVATQLASKNYELASESLDSTVKQVSLSREQADLSNEDFENYREIIEYSISETKDLISLSEDIANQIKDKLDAELAGLNNPETVLGLQQQLSPALSVLFQTRQSLRNLEYQVESDGTQEKLVDVQRRLVFEATELQLKSAQISKDIAYLSLKQAQIAQASTRVSSPLAGTVEKVYVRAGQYVTPGTPVAIVKGEADLWLEILVAGKVALKIDEQQTAEVKGLPQLENASSSLPIAHISSAPVSSSLYQVLIQIPSEYEPHVFQNQSLSVILPLKKSSFSESSHYLPLDALFVTNTDRFVFVAKDGRAVKKSVSTGEIVGGNIEVLSGLASGDLVILDRRVIDQQLVSITEESSL
jgi:RND family efflux transporter MFP subunit